MFTPEQFHVALNHLPFLGAGFALIPLAIGFVTRNKNTVLAGLLVAVLSGWMTPVVMSTGEAAYERYEDGPIARYLDPQAENFLEVHEHRAEAWSKLMYASAAVATIGLALLLWKPSWIRAVSAAAAAFCCASLLSGIWIAESGGLIRRPDFRAAPTGAPSEPDQLRISAPRATME
jgi:hypothetical protein